MSSRRILQAVFCVALSGGLHATTLFNFDSDAINTETTFTDTVDGLSATFSSPADPGGFRVFGSVFSTLTGNVLLSPGSALVDTIPLTLTFNSLLSDISLLFALNSSDQGVSLDFQAFDGATLVGFGSAFGTIPGGGFSFPEGTLSFNGAFFDTVVLSSTALDFAIDSIQVTAVPEPSSWASLALGLGLLGYRRCGARFSAQRRHSCRRPLKMSR